MMKVRDNNLSIFVVLCILFLIPYVIWKNHLVNEYGEIFVLVKNIKWEADSEGSTSIFEVYYNDTIYKANTSGQYDLKEGAFYFAKIIPSPEIEIIEVFCQTPDSFLKMPIPTKGWKRLPIRNCE